MKKLTDEEKKELRRKQQERALTVQHRIDNELKNNGNFENYEVFDNTDFHSEKNKSERCK